MRGNFLDRVGNNFKFLEKKSVVEKELLFKQAIAEIELKHINYFKSRKPKNYDQENDKILNHYTYINEGIKSNISWIKDTDLDAEIISEVEIAFNQIFGH